MTALRAAIESARQAASNIQRLCVPWLDHKGSGGATSDADVMKQLEVLRKLTAVSGEGRNIDIETRRFDDAIDRAFALAVVSDQPIAVDGLAAGRVIGAQARTTLLDEVLFPYNRLLGQVKAHDSTHGLDVLARGAFVRWLFIESRMPLHSRDAIMSVFDAMLDMVEDSRATTHREWDTSRFVWLPLQYGLRAEQYDTQAELDSIVERATNEQFTEGNNVSYVMNEQFQNQLSRTIHAAQSYHVLWTHDFRGHNAKGQPDEMAFRHVLRSYATGIRDQASGFTLERDVLGLGAGRVRVTRRARRGDGAIAQERARARLRLEGAQPRTALAADDGVSATLRRNILNRRHVEGRHL